MKILFATNNPKKVEELKSKLTTFEVVTLNAHGINEEIPETADTLEGNASQKANYIKDNYNIDCFADDTGLEIDALNGEPGVYSARYAGEDRSSDKNMDKVLRLLKNKTNRNAQFKTVISLILNGKETQFTGIVKGTIIDTKKGKDGFGYDPIFVPNGYSKTFAEMTLDEKNTISHRALAVEKLVDFLKKN